MTYQLRNVVIAVVLGLLAAVLTIVYVTNYRKHVQHGQQNVGVLVAATDIPAGTSGAAIVSGHMLKRETVPRTALVPGAISSPDQISRLVSTDESHGRRTGVDAPLRRRQRARRPRTAQGNDARGPALGRPESDPRRHAARRRPCRPRREHERRQRRTASPQHYDRIVLRNLLVLRAPAACRRARRQRRSREPEVLRDARGHRLAVDEAHVHPPNSDPNTSSDGGWALELRPVTNAADSPENVESIDTVLLDGLSASERARVAEGH